MSVIYNEKRTDRYIERYVSKKKFLAFVPKNQRSKGSRNALLLFSTSNTTAQKEKIEKKFFPA